MQLKYKILYITALVLITGCEFEINDSEAPNPYVRHKTLELDDGKIMDFALILPEYTEPGMIHPVLLTFGGGGQSMPEILYNLGQFWVRQSIQRNWIVVSPVAVEGTKYYEGSEKYVTQLLDWVRDNFEVEEDKFHLSGFSNGGKSAFRVALENTDQFLSLMVMPGVLATDTEYALLDRLIGIPVHLYVGQYEIDEWKNKMDSIKVVLDSVGVENKFREFPGQGHVIQTLTSKMLFDTLDTFRND